MDGLSIQVSPSDTLRTHFTVSRYVRDAQIFRDAPASKLGL